MGAGWGRQTARRASLDDNETGHPPQRQERNGGRPLAVEVLAAPE